MMEFLKVTLLAVLQGIAEFLPISSSGHLVIAQHALGVNDGGLRLDIFLHLGTLISIVAFYRIVVSRLLRGLFWRSATWESRREAWAYLGKIILSALPAVAVYLPFHDFLEGMFENARMVGALLMFTGAILIGTRYMPRGDKNISWLRAFCMGLGQAVALLPGVSRSGMTIASARAGRADGAKSAEFSFLMSAPLIGGATMLEMIKCFRAAPEAASAEVPWSLTIYGAVIACVVGYFSLKMLLKALKGDWFWMFGPYCIVAGLATLLLA